MKTKTFLTATAFSILLLFAVGCVKTPGPTPTPTTPPTIQLSGVETTTLNFGDSTSFSWQISGADKFSVFLNKKPMNAVDTYSTGRLLADTTYTLKASNSAGVAKKTISFKVGDWTTSKYGMISHSYWVFDSTGYKTDTMSNFYMYSRDQLDPRYWDDMFYYYPNGTLTVRSKSGTQSTFSHHWKLLPGDSIAISDGRNTSMSYLKYIDKTKLVLYEEGTVGNGGSNDQPAVFITVYKRDN